MNDTYKATYKILQIWYKCINQAVFKLIAFTQLNQGQ